MSFFTRAVCQFDSCTFKTEWVSATDSQNLRWVIRNSEDHTKFNINHVVIDEIQEQK
jgi:hypothetical protein